MQAEATGKANYYRTKTFRLSLCVSDYVYCAVMTVQGEIRLLLQRKIESM